MYQTVVQIVFHSETPIMGLMETVGNSYAVRSEPAEV
jgi:hypothetical protein